MHISQNKFMLRNPNSSKNQGLLVLPKLKLPRSNSKQRAIEPFGEMSSDLGRDGLWSLLHCGYQGRNTGKTLLLTGNSFCLMTVAHVLLQNCEENIKSTTNIHQSSINMPISPSWSGKCKTNTKYSLQIPPSPSAFSVQFFDSPFFDNPFCILAVQICLRINSGL